MDKKIGKDRWALLLTCFISIVGIGLTFTATGQTGPATRNEAVSELERFMPEGVERLYRQADCPWASADPCRLWVAGDQDPQYMILSLSQAGSWRNIGTQAWLRAALPENLVSGAWRAELAPKSDASDPDTFTIKGSQSCGRVQIVERPDEVIIIWMPDQGPVEDFERITVTRVDAPPPVEIKEIRASQPDVIDQDSSGYVWFSSWGNEIYRIDPATDMPQPMTGGTATGTPDGLVVDSSDRVWYGAYGGNYMGMLTADSPLTRFNMPYRPSFAAIPCEAPDGKIWITDHPANRITEFDPVTQQWGRSVTMPVPSAWVVQCVKDPTEPALWMTMYQSSSLGRLDLTTGAIQRHPVPCAPAFLTFDADGLIWTTCWNNGNIVQFDPGSLSGIEYVIPGSGQAGGISISPQGRVAFTQNTLGRVGVLDPKRREAYSYELPARPFFKDGILVDRSGTIWAPSPSRSLLEKIVPE